MFAPDQYQLLDFGDGRKLERFGSYAIDRPSPTVQRSHRQCPELWSQATARFERTSSDRGRWRGRGKLPKAWTIQHDRIGLELMTTESGQIGIFPEQAANWDLVQRRIRNAARPVKVLNLFAYTGGSTLAAAVAGAEIVHVDSARKVVDWARRNARHSGLADAPIRWIVEDVQKFVQRELRRGSLYNAVILDPPSYGHGPRGEPWKLSRDFSGLLRACAELTRKQREFVLVTCHSSGFGPAELQAMLADSIDRTCQGGATARRLYLRTSDGRKLPAGVAAMT